VNFQRSYRKLSIFLISQRKLLLKLALSFVFLILASFLVEYYFLGDNLYHQNRVNESINFSKISENGFNLDENNDLVSQVENATLKIPNQSKFIYNLKLELPKNFTFPIVVSYIDPKTNQEVVLRNDLQRKMEKNKLDFLNQLVFDIRNNPQDITIIAQNPQTTISKIEIDNAYRFNLYHFWFIFSVGLLIFIFVFLRKIIGQKPEFLFLAVALIGGSLISLSETKSFVSWDEQIHYKNADELSFKGIIKKDVKDIFSTTNSLPFSYSLEDQEAINKNFDNNYKKENGTEKTKKLIPISLDFYNKIGYIPSSLALATGRLINLPYHITFAFGRWINILLFSLIVFFAIRKLKSGKMLMAVIALFPTSIFLASNYNYDSWLTAFTMLGLAYLFSALQQPEKKIETKDICIMAGAFVIGLGPKAIYFPLLFLLFLLKPSKFKSLKHYRRFKWAVIFSILFVVSTFLLPFVVSGPKGDIRGGAAVNATEQVKFILHEPLAYAKILLNFSGQYISPKNAHGFITSFAYLGETKGFVLILLLLLTVTFTDRNEYDRKMLNVKSRFSLIGVYLVTVALICTALYISFTVLKSPTIVGVQARYLIPLIFPLLFGIGNVFRIQNKINKSIYNSIIFGIISFVLLQGIWDLIIRKYY
jgi:uncharacterized membrane protein